MNQFLVDLRFVFYYQTITVVPENASEYRKDLDKSQKIRHSEVISNKGYYIIMYHYDCHVHHETVN